MSTLACAYCHLPLPGSHWGDAKPEEVYCCYGCRFAAAVAGATGEQGQASWLLARLGVSIFFSLNVMAFTMALWSGDVYGPAGEPSLPLESSLAQLFRYLCMLLALPVLVLLGGPLLENAYTCLRQGRLNMDLLLVLGVAAAYLYSTQAVLLDAGPIYFEVGCTILVLVTLGRWLEAAGKLRASQALEGLARLLPTAVRRVQASGETTIAPSAIVVGDLLRVLPGERIPTDGMVERQAATVDEQILTGEAASVVKEPGASVHGGTLNLDSELFVRATATADGGALARLLHLLAEARAAKGHYQQLADRLSAWLLPPVLLCAAVATGYHTWNTNLQAGILVGLSVLLIACPCALGIATPLAVWAALGRAAQQRVLFRGGDVLEQLAGVRALCFDKTGTLTTGVPHVRDLSCEDPQFSTLVMERALALAQSSTHGQALSIVTYLRERCAAAQLREIRSTPGRGISGICSSTRETVYLGSVRWLRELHLSFSPTMANRLSDLTAAELPLTCLGWGGQVHAIFAFTEQLRPEVPTALAQLQQMGLALAILTGDHTQRGQALARELGIAVHAELLPEGKAHEVVKAQSYFGRVAFVGDGINDAPALARSDVGIAMGCGADMSRANAGVCLLDDDLRNVPWACALARRTVRIIRQNLFWAVLYNLAGIALACTGRLNPIFAAMAMVASSLLVVGNSLRLAAFAVEEHTA